MSDAERERERERKNIYIYIKCFYYKRENFLNYLLNCVEGLENICLNK